MKKAIILIISFAIFFTANAEGIVSVEPVISDGSLHFYLNSSGGDTTALGIENLSCYSVQGEGIFTYDVDYRMSENGVSVNFRMYNCFADAQAVCVVAALFRNGILEKIEFENTAVSANSAKEVSLEPISANSQTDEIKAYVWDSFGGMKPLGNSEDIDYENCIISRKYAYINCSSGSKFRIYTVSSAVSSDKELSYNVEYNSEKINVENLCAFSYLPILSCGYVKNSGINILEYSASEGTIKYSVKSTAGLSGVNNVIEFSASKDLENEEITLITKK